MLEPALSAARSWDGQVRALAPAGGRPLTHDETVFLFRVQERLDRWLEGLAAGPLPAETGDAERWRAGLRYLQVLQMSVRTTLVRANVGLVRSEASGAWDRANAARRRMTAMALEDQVQEGHIVIGYCQQRVGQLEGRALLKLLMAARGLGAEAIDDPSW